MELTREDLRVSRTCGIPIEKFKEERAREEAEKAATRTTGARPDPDGLTESDNRLIKRFGLDRALFVATRRAFGTA